MPLFIHNVIQFLKSLKNNPTKKITCFLCNNLISNSMGIQFIKEDKGIVKHFCSKECMLT